MAQGTRIDLGSIEEGRFAVMRPVTWGIARKAQAAASSPDGWIPFVYAAMASLVTEWNLADSAGNAVALPRDLRAEQMDDLDVDARLITTLTRAVGDRIREAFGGAADAPNADAPSSAS